jgi:hypothetical protein
LGLAAVAPAVVGRAAQRFDPRSVRPDLSAGPNSPAALVR